MDKEISILKLNIIKSLSRTGTSILYTPPINTVEGAVDLIKSLQHKDYIIDYVRYLQNNELSFFYKHCLNDM